MQTTNDHARIARTATIVIAAFVSAVYAGRLQAQEWESKLMAGLEQPFQQPVVAALSGDLTARLSAGRANAEVRQASYSTDHYDPAPCPVRGAHSGKSTSCATSHISAECSIEDKPWWKRKAHRLNRKAYFNWHRCHPHALHPIVHPSHQPGYGYYETCWRKIIPNPCFCQPDSYSSNSLPHDLSGDHGLQAPSAPGTALPPVPAYDQ